MKNKLEELKRTLKNALSKVPNDFTLFEVKRYINLAISKIESVEMRREKRQKLAEYRKESREEAKKEINKYKGNLEK